MNAQRFRHHSVQDILTMLKPARKRTLAEVAEILSMTRERVAQVEREALWKVSRRMNELLEAETLSE